MIGTGSLSPKQALVLSLLFLLCIFFASSGCSNFEEPTNGSTDGPDGGQKAHKELGPGKNVVLLIDTSGSMEDNDKEDFRVDGAHLLSAVSGFRQNLAVIGYSDETDIFKRLASLSDGEIRRNVVKEIKEKSGGSDGKTNFRVALKKAYSTLTRATQEQPGGPNEGEVVLLTDGENTVGSEQDVRELARKFKRRGWKIHGLALTKKGRTELLKYIVTVTGGVYRKVDRPAELIEAYFEIAKLVYRRDFARLDGKDTYRVPSDTRYIGFVMQRNTSGSGGISRLQRADETVLSGGEVKNPYRDEVVHTGSPWFDAVAAKKQLSGTKPVRWSVSADGYKKEEFYVIHPSFIEPEVDYDKTPAKGSRMPVEISFKTSPPQSGSIAITVYGPAGNRVHHANRSLSGARSETLTIGPLRKAGSHRFELQIQRRGQLNPDVPIVTERSYSFEVIEGPIVSPDAVERTVSGRPRVSFPLYFRSPLNNDSIPVQLSWKSKSFTDIEGKTTDISTTLPDGSIDVPSYTEAGEGKKIMVELSSGGTYGTFEGTLLIRSPLSKIKNTKEIPVRIKFRPIELTVKKSEFDFGSIYTGGAGVSRIVRLKSDKDISISLSRLKKTLVPSNTDGPSFHAHIDKSDYKTGSNGKLQVEKGNWYPVRVEANAGNNDSIGNGAQSVMVSIPGTTSPELRYNWTVEKRLDTSPKSLDFGSVTKQNQVNVTRQLTITNNSEEPIQLNLKEPEQNNNLSLSVEKKSLAIPAGSQKSVTAHLAGKPTSHGQVSFPVYLLENGERVLRIQSQVKIVEPTFTVAPDEISFSITGQSEQDRIKLAVSNNRNEQLTVQFSKSGKLKKSDTPFTLGANNPELKLDDGTILGGPSDQKKGAIKIDESSSVKPVLHVRDIPHDAVNGTYSGILTVQGRDRTKEVKITVEVNR